MKKYLFLILALLLISGVAQAANIPTALDPKNNPEVWTQLVYNGSGSAIASAVIVKWDYDTSDVDVAWDDDRCPWVTVPSEADDIWTAGVVPLYGGIANGSTGSIVIKGPTYVRSGASGTVNTLLGSTASTGYGVDYAAGTDDCAVGRVIKADAVANAAGAGYVLVDVLVSCSD